MFHYCVTGSMYGQMIWAFKSVTNICLNTDNEYMTVKAPSGLKSNNNYDFIAEFQNIPILSPASLCSYIGFQGISQSIVNHNSSAALGFPYIPFPPLF